ncbi:MAG: putative DNA binding domain-containing protein [Spirochaetes bacterium]|nr:putative DNA binding domain-containing protein [Spirochaetota bacterium]
MTKIIDKLLQKLEECITNNKYEPLETEKIELKDSSNAGDWKSIYESVCAFLNTQGGIIILGVKEDTKNKKYIFTGYQDHNETNYKQIANQFTDEKGTTLDLKEYFPDLQIKDFLNARVGVVYIEKLPDDKKYVFYKNKAYKRKFTGDVPLTENEILAQNEYKKELEVSRELLPVINTNIDNIDLDKLNDYIQILNREVKIESIKPDIQSAKSFLERKKFIKEGNPTVLGMLVCGKNTDDFLEQRCQVDCFVNSSVTVVQNKKVIKGNILPLMEESVGFVYKNIQTGVSVENGGKSTPEYPEKLIRESINNALAHRDYSINKYVNINITPGENIEIRNPGGFKETLLIEILNDPIPVRRIIPDTKAKNPKLADILKVYDKWEGKGIGMSTLTNECLNNNINLPYYKFHSKDDTSLIIQSGKLLDEKMLILFNSFSRYFEQKLDGRALTEEEMLVLSYFYKSEIYNGLDRYTILLSFDNNHFNVIKNMEKKELLFRHPANNDKLHTVFIVDRNLVKENYFPELRNIYGVFFDDLEFEAKEILDIFYLHNNFSKKRFPNASDIGNILWSRKDKKEIDKYETFKRKVRGKISRLEKAGFILKNSNKPEYFVNTDFKKDK